MAKRIPPTEKQIAYAAEIAQVCNVEFPTCASQFTKHQFSLFIAQYKDRCEHLLPQDYDDGLEYVSFFGYYDNDAWCEYY